MTNKDHVREEVEKTLQAFDHDLPLTPNPFLFPRIQAERAGQAGAMTWAWFGHIRLKYLVMLGIVVVNLITVIHYADWNAEVTTQKALMSELKTEFSLGPTADGF